jgi:tripartite-type tricarboxylate transporter receptor subunit TctC
MKQWLAVAAIASALASQGACAEPAAEFYRGKTVTIYVGFGPGGGYDAYGQLLGMHMGRHIPGQPTVIVKHMPGAGSLALANFLYNVAPADGTAFGIVAANIAFTPLIGAPQEKATAKYDPARFSWLGSLEKFTAIGIAWHTSGFKTIEDLKQRELRFGSTGPASGAEGYAVLLNELLGTKNKAIRGYRGSNDITLAMEKGEVDGFYGWCWTCMKADRPYFITEKKVNVLVQFALEPEPEMTALGVPFILDLLKDSKDKEVVRLVLGNLAMSRPFVAPPALPPERLKTLREAFVATSEDPLFLASAKKAGRDIAVLKGEEIDALIRASYALPKEIVARASEVSSAK